MKDSRKSRLPPIRKKDAQRLATPARERPQIAARLEPAIYKKLVESAATNGRSVSAEVEWQIEYALTEVKPRSELSVLMSHFEAAFETGGRMRDSDRPESEWLKDSMAYDRGVILGVEALLNRHPDPRWADFMLLLFAIRDRMAAIWRATDAPDFEKGRPLPNFDDPDAEEFWQTSYPRNLKKDEG